MGFSGLEAPLESVEATVTEENVQPG